MPREARGCAAEWARLAAPDPPTGVFEAGMVSQLPEAAARWLCASIPAGTPLTKAAVLRMRGEIKLGSWRPFTASQVVSAGTGFIWAATTRVAGLPFSGFDRYSSGSGQMRWRVLGAVPVMSAAGPDLDRSAAGRLAAESVFVPTGYNQATWAPGPDADSTLATWHIDDHVETVQLGVAADGAPARDQHVQMGQPGRHTARSAPLRDHRRRPDHLRRHPASIRGTGVLGMGNGPPDRRRVLPSSHHFRDRALTERAIIGKSAHHAA